MRAAARLVAWRDWLGEMTVEVAWVQEPLTYLETLLPPPGQGTWVQLK